MGTVMRMNHLESEGQGGVGARPPAGGSCPSPMPGADGHRSLARLWHDLGPWFLGLCCGNIWIGWMNGAHALKPDALWSIVCSAVMIATLLAGIVYGLRGTDRARDGHAADWPIAILMAFSTVPASTVMRTSGDASALLLVMTALGQVGMAWLYVRWGMFLSKLELRKTIGCIFGAHVVGCSVKLALDFLPLLVGVVPVTLMPLLSVALLRRAFVRADDAPKADAKLTTRRIWVSGHRGAWGPLWQVAGFVLVYRLIFQVTMLIPGTSGPSRSLSSICCLAEIAVSVALIYMLFVRSGSFTFHQVWSIFLMLLAVSIVLGIPRQTVPIALSVRSAAGSLLVMFTWLVFASMAYHSDLHPFVVFGIARIAYELPRMVVCPLQLAGLSLDDVLAPSLLLFALFTFAIYFFDRRDPSLALIFSDFDERGPLAEHAHIADLCREAATQYGLSGRETQVLRYLCEGRSRAYIAETMYLSENTVRNHTQSIYAKLGVHSKTELQRRMGV